MHSSRMRTIRCSGHLEGRGGEGVCPGKCSFSEMFILSEPFPMGVTGEWVFSLFFVLIKLLIHWCNGQKQSLNWPITITKQELHSSRMHTTCLLTISPSMHCAGVSALPGGSPCYSGWSALLGGGGSALPGGFPCWGVCLARGGWYPSMH